MTNKEILNDICKLRPLGEYTEEHGFVLLWHLPVCEPPYFDNPCTTLDESITDLVESGWITHWSKLPPQEEYERVNGWLFHD